jgi:hypothetical protein
LEFGGDRGDVSAVVNAGGDGVPVVCDCAPGGPGLADGVGRVGQLGLYCGPGTEYRGAFGKAAEDEFAGVSGDGRRERVTPPG